MPHAPALSLLHAASTRPAPALVQYVGQDTDRRGWGLWGFVRLPLVPPRCAAKEERAEDVDA